MQAQISLNNDRQLLIDINDLCAFTRLSKASIYRLMNMKNARYDATFPRPVDLGVNINLWRYEDVKNWVDTRCTKATNITKRNHYGICQ